MSKEIIAVFQDCVFCGDKGRKKATELAKEGVIIRKVGFTTKEGKDLIHKAVFEHKIGSMPFFTDGERFSVSLDEIIEKPATKVEKIPAKVIKNAKKTKKNAKEPKDVAV